MRLHKLLPILTVTSLTPIVATISSCTCSYWEVIDLIDDSDKGMMISETPISFIAGKTYQVNIDLSKYSQGVKAGGPWLFGMGAIDLSEFHDFGQWTFSVFVDNIEQNKVLTQQEISEKDESYMFGIIPGYEKKGFLGRCSKLNKNSVMKMVFVPNEDIDNLTLMFGPWGG